jgi:elongation factor P
MAIKATTIRKGKVILHNNAPQRVLEFQHLTPGNLHAYVAVKLRNLLSGNQTETRFNADEKIEEADVHVTKATFLYQDSEGYHFMTSETYEQYAVSAEIMGDAVYYLQDEMEVGLTTFNGDPIGIELPQTVILTIADTEPELRGATASNSPKPAKTTSGLSLSVPPFVKIGDRIVVNTEEGTYVKRAE